MNLNCWFCYKVFATLRIWTQVDSLSSMDLQMTIKILTTNKLFLTHSTSRWLFALMDIRYMLCKTHLSIELFAAVITCKSYKLIRKLISFIQVIGNNITILSSVMEHVTL